MQYVIVGNTGDEEAEREDYHAYFVWRDAGEEREEVYSVADLETEIARLREMGRSTAVHEAALKRLRIVNGID